MHIVRSIFAVAARHLLLGLAIAVTGHISLNLSYADENAVVDPAAAGLDGDVLAKMEPLIVQALAERKMPGCVVAVGRHDRVGWLKSHGSRRLVPDVEPMTTDTVFDLASLTKPVATATSILLLHERQRLRLDDRVATIIPEFHTHGKDVITIEQLLIHQSGLIADNAMTDYRDGPAKAFERIFDLPLKSPVGEKFVYSDVNFIVLGACVERLTGQTVQEFTREHLFGPLEMRETGFLPPESLGPRIAPTQQRDGHWMQGEVHDPRAHALGGVAGHAGLFSTAADLIRYAQMMLNRGSFGGRQILAPATVALMTHDYPVSAGIRGLGWDKQTPFSTNKGTALSPSAFGHGGFTGTVLWIDPEQDLFLIFLSNRVHPDGKGVVNPLAGQLATIAAEAVIREPR